MRAQAFAKINLSLDIAGRRADGYHTLKMVMQSISLFDEIEVDPAQSGGVQVFCDADGIPCGENNTALRAAGAFFTAAGLRKENLTIRIRKRIPSQAGLGGGSTDAAAVLRLLNSMDHTGFSPARLREIGLSVGADVPFCVEGGTALAEGIGEKICPVSALPPCKIVVCRPSIGISTKEAYSRFDESGCRPTRYTESVLAALQIGKLAEIGKNLGNAFELSALPGDIAAIKRVMFQCGSVGACMTGSGSAVFGLFDDSKEAETCRQYLAKRYSSVFLCRPVADASIAAG